MEKKILPVVTTWYQVVYTVINEGRRGVPGDN